jgi:DNA-binding CsgD family transcriptional regulator
MRDIEARLGRIPLDQATISAVPGWLVPALHDLLGGGPTAAYRPTCSASGKWGLGELVSSDDVLFSTYDAKWAQASGVVNYDPRRPEPEQRNRALRLHEVHLHGPETTCVVERVWPEVGLGGYDQLRVLVCEGPALLAWIGGLREEPYTSRECDLLRALVPSLQRALPLHRRLLDAGILAAGLAQALEAMIAPAFVAHRDGRIDHANTAGVELADDPEIDACGRLRDAIEGRETASFTAHLEAPGVPERFLVVLRERGSALELRLREAAKDWHATDRELHVLRWLVTGDSNKEIAVKLGRSEVSVERRITSLLHKAKCDGRARLIVRFWTG